jgi:hypothetical protein
VNEMVRRFLRQKFSSTGIVVALSVILLFTGGQPSPETAMLPLLILAAGCVSRDASSGALQMILCRPLSRTDYLLGRYLGVLASFAAFQVAGCALAVLFSRLLLPALGRAPRPIGLADLGTTALTAFLPVMAWAALILFFSTFLPGYGDVLAFILVMPLTALPDAAGQLLNAPWLREASPILRRNLLPEVEWWRVLHGQQALGAALVVFSRREFAYGND